MTQQNNARAVVPLMLLNADHTVQNIQSIDQVFFLKFLYIACLYDGSLVNASVCDRFKRMRWRHTKLLLVFNYYISVI